ncbi:alpha/beta fold hydrolase [Streptomyces chartreusis]
MSTASVGGITIGYEDQGNGDPLVLIHGHPFDRSMWEPQINHFSQAGWRVIAPDLRGYGESTVVPGKTTLETFVRDIVGLLDSLGIDRFVLGGLSMGGQIVMEFYRLFPDRIRGLLLADTFAAAETDAGKTARYEMAERLLREGMRGYAEEVLPKMVAPYNIKALPDVAQHVLLMMSSTSPEGAAAALRGRAERPDYIEMLSHVAVPTLVVVGVDDEFTPVSDARLIHERVSVATLAVIHEAAHMPNLERVTEFNTALEKFLASVPADTNPDR